MNDLTISADHASMPQKRSYFMTVPDCSGFPANETIIIYLLFNEWANLCCSEQGGLSLSIQLDFFVMSGEKRLSNHE